VMRLSHNSLVLVADGAKMLFFRNEGDAEYPNLKVVEAVQQATPRDSEINTDQAGQKPGGGGPGGSTASEADSHDLAEQRFAAEAADQLKRGALAGDYDELVVVAPPRTLGVLRKHYHSEVEKRLIHELAKDLTGHPVDQIEKILAETDK
jgi:protein required for attachment to host cells